MLVAPPQSTRIETSLLQNPFGTSPSILVPYTLSPFNSIISEKSFGMVPPSFSLSDTSYTLIDFNCLCCDGKNPEILFRLSSSFSSFCMFPIDAGIVPSRPKASLLSSKFVPRRNSFSSDKSPMFVGIGPPKKLKDKSKTSSKGAQGKGSEPLDVGRA